MNKELCQICNKKFESLRSLSAHVKRKHNINIKKYYDKFFKTDTEGICLTCGNPTNYCSMNTGYRKFCSIKCNNSNNDLVKQRSSKSRKTKRENPEIKKNQIKNFKKTIENNPDIIKERIITYKETIKNNPEIVRQRKIVRAHTMRKDPKIQENASRKRNKTISMIPRFYKNLGEKHSIYLRNKYNGMSRSDSTQSHFLYIIQHLEKSIIKIGRSEDPRNRLNGIIKEFGDCKIIYALEGSYRDIQPLESYLHNYFNDYCKVQKSGNGKTEWFDESILDDALEIISNV